MSEYKHLTLIRLKEFLYYSKSTGEFTWRVSRGKAKRGERAGSLDSEGYLNIGIDKKRYRAHRLAWFYVTGYWPKHEVDHKNRIRRDNKWKNLREATDQDNAKNHSISCTNRSGVTGVMYLYTNAQGIKMYRTEIGGTKMYIRLGVHRFQKAKAIRLAAEVAFDYYP